jgi:branched-chain amino acid transport system substrate-binding protein
MSESRDDKDLPQGTRRKWLKASALTLAGAGLYGAAPFYGPWKTNRARRRARRRSRW